MHVITVAPLQYILCRVNVITYQHVNLNMRLACNCLEEIAADTSTHSACAISISISSIYVAGGLLGTSEGFGFCSGQHHCCYMYGCAILLAVPALLMLVQHKWMLHCDYVKGGTLSAAAFSFCCQCNSTAADAKPA